MLFTLLIVLLHSQCQTGNDKAFHLDVPTLCQMLSSSQTVCPFFSVSENLVCFESSNRASKPYGSEQVKTNVCQNWSSITFTKIKGRQCIQNKLKPQKKSDVHVKSVCSQTENITLHQASKDGNITAVRCFLLKDQTDINSRGEFEQTPAMVAVRNKYNQRPAQLFRPSGHTAVINLCKGRKSIG